MAAEEQLLAQLEAARAEVAALEAALDVAQLPTASTAAVLPQPLQYSPLFSDRATNWMTQEFGDALRELSATLRQVYHADSVAFIPGAGSYGMEAAARQFGQDRVCLTLRHGYFSYRWTQIFEVCRIPSREVVISAIPDGPLGDAEFPQFSPGPLSEILEAIRAERPAFVCAPHVETSTGIMLPDEYIRAIGEATRSVGGVFCLDCIASGCAWVDMESLAVDCIVTAPQKGWSGPACCGIVLLNARARALVEAAPLETETIGSYCCNLKTWLAVMAEYEEGGCTDHTTLPTDALVTFRDVVRETAAFGFGRARQRMMTLGQDVRAALAARGLRSVAAAGFESPGVVVFYASAAAGVPTAGFLVEAMKGRGVQIAGGVPFKLPLLPSTATEPEDFDPRACAFRVGLFGLDKLRDVEHASARFLEHLDAVIGAGAEQRQATAADGAGAGLVSKL